MKSGEDNQRTVARKQPRYIYMYTFTSWCHVAATELCTTLHGRVTFSTWPSSLIAAGVKIITYATTVTLE